MRENIPLYSTHNARVSLSICSFIYQLNTKNQVLGTEEYLKDFHSPETSGYLSPTENTRSGNYISPMSKRFLVLLASTLFLLLFSSFFPLVNQVDRGWYMCQLNTDPMRSQKGYIEVQGIIRLRASKTGLYMFN